MLKEVKVGDSIKVVVNIPLGGHTIKEYHIGVDFIKEEDLKQRNFQVDQKSNKVISSKGYISRCRSLYFNSNR